MKHSPCTLLIFAVTCLVAANEARADRTPYYLSMACAYGAVAGMAPGTPNPTLYCTMGASVTTSAAWANYFSLTANGIPSGRPTAITYRIGSSAAPFLIASNRGTTVYLRCTNVPTTIWTVSASALGYRGEAGKGGRFYAYKHSASETAWGSIPTSPCS